METEELDKLYELLKKFNSSMIANIDPPLSAIITLLENREKEKNA